MVAAAFCNSMLALVCTQGLLDGIGCFILDVPVLLILNTWFIRHRGLAYGITFVAMDVFGFGFSFLAQVLLRKYGFKATPLIFAAAMFAIPGATMFLLQERSRDPLPRNRNLSAIKLPQPPVPEGHCLT